MRRLVLITLLLAGVLATPAAGQSAAERQVIVGIAEDYRADGQIDPCDWTSDQLTTALENVGADTRQYGADYPAAIRAALAARARGDCEPGGAEQRGGSGGGVTPAATPTPPPATSTPDPAADTGITYETVIPEPPGPDAQLAFAPATTSAAEPLSIGDPGNDAPTPLLLLGVLAILAGVGGAATLGSRRVTLAEGPLAEVRHAWREAAWRFGGGWESFRDWVRVGR